MAPFARIARDRISGPRLAVTAAAAILAAAAAQARTTDIGSVAAANEDVVGTPPDAGSRQLTPGLNLLLYERIETSDVGAGQFLFLDQTSMTVWPNSDVVLDEYVYDPDRGSGEMALSMTRGVLRFIGGQISKDNDVDIRTQHAVVAVRGGIAQVSVTETGTRATLIAGDYVRISGLDGQRPVTLSRSGATAQVLAGGEGAEFVGVGGEEETAALYGEPAGEGDGGATQEVSNATVEPLIQAEVTALGSGDPRAPTRRPVSTRGESFAEPAVAEDDQLAQVVTDDRVEAIAEDNAQEAVEGERATPILGAAGARFGVPDGGVLRLPDGTVIDDPAARNIVFTGQPFGAIGSASRGAGGLTATDADGNAIVIPDTPGFSVLRDADGAVIGQSFVAADGDFALQARTGSRFLDFFGAPTPASVWTDAAAPVRVYDLSDELFTLAGLPLPASTGDVRFDTNVSEAPLGGDLLLVPQSGAPLVGDPANGLGFANSDPQFSKWLLGFLDIRGTGPAQTSALGALTGQAVVNASGQPTLNNSLTAGAALNAFETPSRINAPFGIAPGAGGASIFGADGNYFVLGNLNQFVVDTDPDFEALPALLITFSEGAGFDFERYGDTRLAALAETLRPADRLPLAAALADDPDARAAFAAAPAPPGHGFDGGFAATAGFGMQGTQRVDSYLLTTTDVRDVQVGFDTGANSVAVAFNGLTDAFGDSAASSAALSFGDSRGAFLDDGAFAARQVAQTTSSSLSAAAPTLGGRTGAFRGQLASAGLVGDGGVFPDGVDTAPDALRWGWWGGSFEFRAQPDPALDGRVDYLHLGSFVAGVQADAAIVAGLTGVATFDGFAVGHVLEQTPDGLASYVDGAAFALSYDLGARVGDLTLSDLAGQRFTAQVSSLSFQSAAAFGGFFDGLDSDVSFVRGGFFADGADEIAAAAGSFEIETTTLSGALARITGVFGGDRSDFDPDAGFQSAPLPGFVGAAFTTFGDTEFTDAFGQTVVDAGLIDMVVAPENRVALDSARQETRLDTAGGEFVTVVGVSSATGEEREVTFADTVLDPRLGPPPRDVTILDANDVAVGDGVSGGIDDAFFIDVARLDDGERSLTFVGQPTPTAVWSAPSGEDVDVRVYGIGNNLFSDARLPLPAEVDAAFESAEVNAGGSVGGDALLFIPQTGGPLIGDPADGFGFANTTRENSRIAFAYLVIDGGGGSQRSSFGAMTGALTTTEAGQPSFGSLVRSTTQRSPLVASDDPGIVEAITGVERAFMPFGLLDDGAGNTVFGSDGRNAVAGNVAPYLEPGVNAVSVDTPAYDGTQFGDTRLLDLDPARGFTLSAADRLALAIDPATSTLAGAPVDPVVEGVLDGGFAAATLHFDESGQALVGVVLTTNAGDVRLAFDIDRTGAAAEFANLALVEPGASPFPVGIDAAVSFGGFDGRGALLDDRRFVMDRSGLPTGPITGEPLKLFGDAGRAPDPSTGDQRAFRGTLASMGYVGDGGIFPAGVETDLETVRAGWWSGGFRYDDAPSDAFHLGSFVAGVQGDLSIVQGLDASATYTGFAVAHVIEDFRPVGGGVVVSYVDGGGFTASYDFGSRSGQALLTDIAGFDIAIALDGANGVQGAQFTGALSPADSSDPLLVIDGQAQGAFFSDGAGDATAGIGGSFAASILRASSLTVTGVFGADRDAFFERTTTPLTTVTSGVVYAADADAGFTSARGVAVANPAEAQVLVDASPRNADFLTGDGAAVDRATRTIEDGRPNPFITLSDTANGDSFSVDEIPGLTLLSDLDPTLTGTNFAAPDLFYLRAEIDPATGAATLAFAGAPTASSVWETVSDNATVEARIYSVSNDLFRDSVMPLPDVDGYFGLTDTPLPDVAFNGDLLLIPQLDGPVVEAAAGEPRNSRWMLGALSVVGEGRAQASALSVMTGRVTAGALFEAPASRQPVLGASLQTSAKRPGSPSPALGTAPLALLTDADGATAYGDFGDFLVLGTATPVDDAPARRFLAPEPAVFQELQSGLDIVYGDTRLAVLDETFDLATAARLPLASLFDVVAEDAFPSARNLVQFGFSGGFAAAGVAAVENGALLDAYLINSDTADSVVMGVNLGAPSAAPDLRTGVAAEFAFLREPFDDVIDNIRVTWGGFNGRSALLDDTAFAMLDTNDGLGVLSQQSPSINDDGEPRPLAIERSDGDDAFRGQLASAGLVGDGGVFEAGVDAEPEYLRWGWWGGRVAHDPGDATFAGREEQMHLGSFVTGVRSDISIVQGLEGTATFDGHAVGHVLESDGAQYVDGGRFEMVYDLGTRTGSATISQILDQSVTADIEGLSDIATHYQGGLPGGEMRGAFFRGEGGPLDAISATAGSFEYQALAPSGNAAQVVGVFGADRTACQGCGP